MKHNIQPDIVAKITFYHSDEGGRKEPTRNDFFGCPLKIHRHYYDCRLLLFEHGAIYPGQTVIVPIKFLDSPTVLKILHVGDAFELWDRRVFAEGEVVEIIS